MKTKNIILIFCLTMSGLALKAQEKYEYLIIEYVTWAGKINISIDGKEFTKENVDYTKHDKSGYNANPLLEKVKEYEAKNWEVMTLNLNHVGSGGAEVYYSYMRKKRTETK